MIAFVVFSMRRAWQGFLDWISGSLDKNAEFSDEEDTGVAIDESNM